MSGRDHALEILERVAEGAFATPLLDRQKGDIRDVNFVRTIVLGVLRWRLRLDYVIETLAGRKAGKIDPIPLQLLRIGIYQIMFMDVPAYAAVSETVTLTARRAARAKGFVNAVLRKAAKTDLHAILPKASGEDLQRLSVEFAHPDWLVARWLPVYGAERTKAILGSNQNLSYPDIVVNERQLSIESAEGILREKNVRFGHSSIVPGMLRIEGSTSSLEDEMTKGYFYAMDEGSALVASLVDVKRGPVLDLAAAPGGKSIVMAMRGGTVTSNDVSLGRLSLLRRTYPALFPATPRLVVSDGRFGAFRPGSFRTILLDSPCSATGTIRKNPEIKWRLTADALASFARLQSGLLAASLELAPEQCIYSTCSLEREENDAVIEKVLEANPMYELTDVGASAPPGAAPWIDNGVLRLTPESGTDGFTAFMLSRKA